MTDPRPKLHIVEPVSLAPEHLDLLSRQWDVSLYKTVEEIVPEEGGSVLLLDPVGAKKLLSRSPNVTVSNSAPYAVVVWSNEAATPVAQDLLAHPRMAGVLDPSCRRETIYAGLKAAFAVLAEQRNAAVAQRLERVLEIGRALASEKDLDTLLGLILEHARNLTGADGASIYTRDNAGKLFFRLWQNASTRSTSSAQKTLVGEYSIANYVARSGETVILDDVYAIPITAPYKFNPASDSSLGYRTRSLLTVALKNKAGETVGVLQLINRKADPAVRLLRPEDFERLVLPFDRHGQEVALALAGQAGVALENSILYADIERLFEGFIKASVQAIEARDPTTAGHSFRVADFSERLAAAVDRADEGGWRDHRFTREQMRELRYAALLHDFGKVGVREHVLVKSKKLYPHQLELLKQRFRYARACLDREAYRKLLELHERRLPESGFLERRREIERALLADQTRLEEYLQNVLCANEPAVSHQEVANGLELVAGFTFPGDNGEITPLLRDFEFNDLALSKGSLNPEERIQIESHVSHTYAFLSLIPWTKSLAKLPDIAYAHHEKLDGTGYPRRLSGTQIPVQSRIMTIADIYDALTAADRPYKRSLPEERALGILEDEAESGKIDIGLFQIFVESEAYRLPR